MKYAVVEISGKQLKLSEGESFYLDKNILMDAKDQTAFDKILLFSDGAKTEIGTPYVVGMEVLCDIKDGIKKEKVVAETFKAKSRYHKKIGLKRELIPLVVTEIRSKNPKEEKTEKTVAPKQRTRKKKA